MFAVMTLKSWHSFSLTCGLVACISGNPIPGAHTVLGSTNLQQRNKTLCHHYISQLLWTTVWFNLVIQFLCKLTALHKSQPHNAWRDPKLQHF